MNCPVCGRLEYDCECEPSEPIPEIGGEDDTEDALREHQEEQPQETCKNCEKPLERFPNMLRCLEWRHSDGYYNCGGRLGHAETYAEPVQSAKKDRKDAGDERLLCAVLFEEGEPN